MCGRGSSSCGGWRIDDPKPRADDGGASDEAVGGRRPVPRHGARVRGPGCQASRRRDGAGIGARPRPHRPVLRDRDHGDRDSRSLRGSGGKPPHDRARGGRAVRGGRVARDLRRCAEHACQQPAPQVGERRTAATLSPPPRRRCRGRLRAVGARVRLGRVRPADEGHAPTRPLGARGPQVVDHQRGRSGAVRGIRERRLHAGLQRDHRVRDRARLPRALGRQEGRQARHPRVEHVRTDPRRLRAARDQRSGRGGQRLQGGDRDPQHRPHRHRRSNDRRSAGGARCDAPVREGAQPIRASHRRVPGGTVPARPGRDGARGGAPDGLQRRAPRGRGRAVHDAGGDGQALLLAGRRAGDIARRGAVRRVRVHEGVRGREVLPRRQDRHDLRGDEQHAAEHDREAAPEVAPPPAMHTARRTHGFTESVIRGMTRLANEHGAINLAQGFPNFPAPDALKDAAARAIRDDINQYAITWGAKRLRDALARKYAEWYGMTVDPETEVTITCGATEAMASAMLALVDPGDEVIVFEPFYENYGPDTILCGARPVYVPLAAGDPLDLDRLARAFSQRTRAIIVCTPNNPTGRVLSGPELEGIAELCRRYDAYAVTDEIYEHIYYEGKHIPIATLDGMRERTITISGASKTFSVTGWRVGTIVAPPEATDAIRKVHDFLTVGAAAPLQEAIAVGLETLGPDYYRGLAAQYRIRRDLLYEALLAAGFRCTPPEGAYYILADFSRLSDRPDDEFARWLTCEAGVAPVPGSSFFSRPELGRNLVRFAFCKTEDQLREAGARLRAVQRAR